MLAARFHGKGDIRLEDVPTPSIKASDDVLVEVHYCGICGTDLHEYLVGPIVTPTSPHPLTGATLPQTLGHEFSARVRRDRARRPGRPGRRPGRDHAGHRLRHAATTAGAGWVTCACTSRAPASVRRPGAWPQYAVLKEYQVAVLPDEVSDLEGAVVEPAMRRGIRHRPRRASRGATSSWSPAPARSASCRPCTRVRSAHRPSSSPSRTRTAPSSPAPSISARSSTRPSDGLRRVIAGSTGGIGVDVVAECSGSTPGLGTAITHTTARGSIVQTGLHTKPATLDAMALVGEGHQPVRQLVLPHHRLAAHHPADRVGQVPGRQGSHGTDPSGGRRVHGLRRPRRPARRPAQGPRPRPVTT